MAKKREPIKLTAEEADMLIDEINNTAAKKRWRHCPFQWRWDLQDNPMFTPSVRQRKRHCVGFCGALFPEIELNKVRDFFSMGYSCPNGCDRGKDRVPCRTISVRVIKELRQQDWIY